ncbi:uncharacterized protein [Nicotiana tomentosiformis]|uniref:uncharacterized protein n=1 Tax=Nicotiana tomentosiformis TaxID=4098 RepID=UPI00388C967E
MVRTRTAGSNDQTPAPPARAARCRGRGRGRGRPCGESRARARAATEKTPVAPVGGQAPETPVTIPALQETLAQFLSMFSTLAQAGLILLALATSQSVAPVQPAVRATASEVEQLRLERYKKYHPPTFSVLASEDAQGFLKDFHRILCTMGVAETSGVSFTTFQLRGAAYQWWCAYKLDSSAEAASFTLTQLSDMFLREYVPRSIRDAWRIEYEYLHQGAMTVIEYAIRFSALARHASALVAIVRERVRRFIEGLNPNNRLSMARELEIYITYQQVVGIARRLEGMLTRDREKRKSKRSQESGTYSGTRSPATVVGAEVIWVALFIQHFQLPVRIVEKGCDVYLAYVRDVSVDTLTVESVLVVRDFANIIPADHPSMPPDRDIDFGIDFLPGTQHISIPPYRMAPIELKDLKEQFQELLDKGFIRPSVSPWGAPIFREDHEQHMRTVLQTLREKELYAKLLMYEFWLDSVAFLDNVVSSDGIKKGALFRWTDECKKSFQKLKTTLTTIPVERQYNDPHLLVLKDTVQHGDVKELTIGDDGVLWGDDSVLRMKGRLCVHNVDGLRELILQEAHSLRYSILPGASKMYQDLS